RVGEIPAADLDSVMLEFPAREVLLPDSDSSRRDGQGRHSQAAGAIAGEGNRFGAARVTRWEGARFDVMSGRTALERQFQVLRLDAFGLETEREGYGAAGALLDYLKSLKKSDLPQLRELRPLREGKPLVMDEVTFRNLEVFESPAGPDGTLLKLLDRTETGMGARALRARLRAPSSDRAVIEARLERTKGFAASATLRSEARDRLHRFPDLERSLGLLGSGRASPRDLGAVRDAVRRIPPL